MRKLALSLSDPDMFYGRGIRDPRIGSRPKQVGNPPPSTAPKSGLAQREAGTVGNGCLGNAGIRTIRFVYKRKRGNE